MKLVVAKEEDSERVSIPSYQEPSEGKILRPDLYIVAGNPLEDIKATKSVSFVIKNGEVYDPGALLRASEGKIGPMGAEDHDYWKLQVEPLVPLM